MTERRSVKYLLYTATVFGWGLASAAAFASEPPVNTGGTSFMDGFGDPTGYGVTYMNYLSWATSNSIKDSSGNSVPVFKDPRLNAIVDLNQFIYTFNVPDTFIAQPGVNAIVPLVDLSSSFGAGGPSLPANGFGLGDITLGAFLQFKPVVVEHHPLFAQRVEFEVVAPTGKYSSTKDINPGSHAWAIIPYWAATLLPIPRLEFSNRINYLYNFENGDPMNTTPGSTATSTQEGQAIWDNFAVAFEVLPHDDARTWMHSLRVGVNGYYFKQITENKTNGAAGSGTKEQTLGIGPGLMWIVSHQDAIWVNTYFETAVKNRFASDVFQIRWAHSFASF